jgi:hypothetical protein
MGYIDDLDNRCKAAEEKEVVLDYQNQLRKLRKLQLTQRREAETQEEKERKQKLLQAEKDKAYCDRMGPIILVKVILPVLKWTNHGFLNGEGGISSVSVENPVLCSSILYWDDDEDQSYSISVSVTFHGNKKFTIAVNNDCKLQPIPFTNLRQTRKELKTLIYTALSEHYDTFFVDAVDSPI